MLKIREIREAVFQTAQRHGLDKVTLFGSYARGDAQEHSDVDLVIESSRPLGFVRGQIYRELEQAFCRPVDIVFGEKNLYPFVQSAVKTDGMVLYEA